MLVRPPETGAGADSSDRFWSQYRLDKGASVGRVGLKPFDKLRINSAEDRIEATRAAFATDFASNEPRRGFDTFHYSTDGA